MLIRKRQSRMLKRYGKSSGGLLKIKSSFFDENEHHLSINRNYAEIYAAQPIRNLCKNCDSEIGGSDVVDFTSHSIPYRFCKTCGHLNGLYQDTNEFCESIYMDDESDYADAYLEKDIIKFNERTKTIYTPKVEFLRDSLNEAYNINLQDLRVLDIGAGSGYFISALKSVGVSGIGLEASRAQCNLGNQYLGAKDLQNIAIEKLPESIGRASQEIISMIGVLEHLQNPREVLKKIKDNQSIEFLFISLPLFSYSVILETIFQNSFNRQLGGGHTHLYTAESIKYMAKEFDLKSVAEWWFGTDFVDLYRHSLVNLSKRGVSDYVIDQYKDSLGTKIDDMQILLDEDELASEVHILFKT